MTVGSVILALFAAASPLPEPESYTFAPFGAGTNAGAFVKGEIFWPLPGIRAVRAEDLAFLEEAFAERYGFLYGGFSNTVNAIGALHFDPRARIRLEPLRRLAGSGYQYHGLPCYCDPDAEMEEDVYFPPFGEALTNFSVVAGAYETNYTAHTITNYATVTNSYRADWPPVLIVTNVTEAVTTNITLGSVVTSSVSQTMLADYILKDGSGFVPISNIFHGVESRLDTIPRVADMTNLYALAARCTRAASIPDTLLMADSVARVENFHYSYNRYSWISNGWVETTRVITNGTRTLMGPMDVGQSVWRAIYSRSRSQHTEWVDGSPVVSYSPAELTRDQYEQYNPIEEPVKFRLPTPHDAAQGRVESAKIFIRYRIYAWHNLFDNSEVTTNIYSFATNLYPVKVYDGIPMEGSNEVLVVDGPLEEFELAQTYGLPLIAPVGYPEMYQSRDLGIRTTIEEVIAIVTPTFTTVADQGSERRMK